MLACSDILRKKHGDDSRHEKRFREFSLEADEFILKELRENESFDIIVDLLERIIIQKQNVG